VSLPNHAPSRAMTCCPLTNRLMLTVARSQTPDAAPLAVQPDSSGLNVTSFKPTRLEVPLRIPNRGHAYLLDCAFLI
jgi:hypothetical protein